MEAGAGSVSFFLKGGMTYNCEASRKIRAVRILTLGGPSFLQQVSVWKYTRVQFSLQKSSSKTQPLRIY